MFHLSKRENCPNYRGHVKGGYVIACEQLYKIGSTFCPVMPQTRLFKRNEDAARAWNHRFKPVIDPPPKRTPVKPVPSGQAETKFKIPSQYGAAIKAARLGAGLSQRQVAQKLNTHTSNIIRLEMNRNQPTSRTLNKIADATGHQFIITVISPQPINSETSS